MAAMVYSSVCFDVTTGRRHALAFYGSLCLFCPDVVAIADEREQKIEEYNERHVLHFL